VRVATTVPDEWRPILERVAKEEGFSSIGRWVFELIRSELKAKGYIGNGGDSNE